MSVTNIRTRYAIVKNAERLLKQVDDFFEDAANWGVSVAEADPRGELVAIRKGLIHMLDNERRLGIVKLDTPSGGHQ
jgi:hypothetical protein